MNSPRTTLYRDKSNAKLMGVCSGIADYTGVDAFWVRLGFLGLTFMTGGSTIPFYFLAGLLLNLLCDLQRNRIGGAVLPPISLLFQKHQRIQAIHKRAMLMLHRGGQPASILACQAGGNSHQQPDETRNQHQQPYLLTI